jgi:hypothetical protein
VAQGTLPSLSERLADINGLSAHLLMGQGPLTPQPLSDHNQMFPRALSEGHHPMQVMVPAAVDQVLNSSFGFSVWSKCLLWYDSMQCLSPILLCLSVTRLMTYLSFIRFNISLWFLIHLSQPSRCGGGTIHSGLDKFLQWKGN